MLDQFDDLCAKDAVRFLHDVDDYSFHDSVDFSIENVVLTNWSRTFIVRSLLRWIEIVAICLVNANIVYNPLFNELPCPFDMLMTSSHKSSCPQITS